MVAWAIKDFGGMIPRTESRNLPQTMAEAAWNCDLSSGNVEGLPIPQQLVDLSGTAGTQRAYRYPDPTGGTDDAWIPLPSPFSSACRSPLANDTNNRVYWTNPPDSSAPGAWWSTYADIIASNPPYNLGMIYPDPTVAPGVTSVGGTLDGSVPLVARSYCWTYVDSFGSESAPSAPSPVVNGAPDGTWTVTGMPGSAPSNPSGFNYAPVVGVNLYRTVTGATTGAVFYQVAQFTFASSAPPSNYVDAVLDTAAADNIELYTTSFANPLAALDGLVAFPGGMLVGFSGNTVHFCEPDYPHAWPAAYDQSMQYEIQTLGVWQQALLVVTAGFPSTGTGSSPENFTFSQVRVPEPCIARGSMITDLMGVYYASQNGIVMLNYFGMQNQTLTTMSKNIWLTDFAASGIIAARHRAQYLALRTDGSGVGFLIDYTEQRMGVMKLSTFDGATAIWNDEYNGSTYICAAGVVYLWDSPTAGPQIYRWRSKQFYNPAPINLGAAQVTFDPAITTATASDIPLSNGDPTIVLPDGVNAVFNLYAGPDGEHLVHTWNLAEVRNIFSLPSGFKAFDWQCEIISRVGLRSVEIATTMKELNGV